MRILMAIEMGRKRRLEGEITLQEQESGSSNLEWAALRVHIADSIRRKHRASLIALVLMAAFSLSLATAQENSNSNRSSPAIPQS